MGGQTHEEKPKEIIEICISQNRVSGFVHDILPGECAAAEERPCCMRR